MLLPGRIGIKETLLESFDKPLSVSEPEGTSDGCFHMEGFSKTISYTHAVIITTVIP